MNRARSIAFVASALVASAAQPADSIRIGLVAPLTGVWMSEGKAIRNSVELLVDELNTGGGLLGKHLELVVEDDGSEPRIASVAAQRLAALGVVAVLGSYASSATEATQNVFDEAKIVQVAVGSTAVRLSEKGLRYFFRVCPRDDEQGRVAADTLARMRARRVAILHDNSTYSKGLADQAAAILVGSKQIPLVFFDALRPREQDYAPVLERLRATKPDVVFFTGYYPEAGLLLRQRKRMGWEVPFVGGDAVNNPDLVKIATRTAAEGFLYLSPPVPRDLDSAQARAFLERYRTRYREELGSTYGVLAADALRVVASAIEATRGTAADKLAGHLKGGLGTFKGFTGSISFDAKGDRVGELFRVYRIRPDGSSALLKGGRTELQRASR